MGEKEIIEVPINKRKIVTIPDSLMNLFNAKIGDTLAFKKEGDKVIVGLIKRTVVEENIKFKIDI